MNTRPAAALASNSLAVTSLAGCFRSEVMLLLVAANPAFVSSLSLNMQQSCIDRQANMPQ